MSSNNASISFVIDLVWKMMANILKISNKDSLTKFSMLLFLFPVRSFLLLMGYHVYKYRMKAQESVALFQDKNVC
jgi:hypothetical protein